MQNKYLIIYVFKNNSVEAEQKVINLTDGQAEIISIEMRDIK